MKSTKEIVSDFFDTFEANLGWESMLAPDLYFSSPMDETNSKDAFIELDKQFRQLVVKASVHWIITEGEQASATVRYQMALPTGDTLDIDFSEIIKIKGQKIAYIKVFYDTVKFKDFLSKMKQ